MQIRLRVIALLLPLVSAPLAVQRGAAQSGAAPALPPGRPTDQPPAELAAKLKTGPPLPYKVAASWPQVPKGYNLGEVSGVDIDQQGNVWVFNRGHWPVFEFDRGGKMLQAWNEDAFHVKSAHGLRVAPDGNIWCIDVDGYVVFKMSPEGRVLMVLGNRQGVPGNNDSHDAFYRPTNVAFRQNGNFYVADGYVNSRVIEFNPLGEYVRHWGTKGTGDGEFNLVHDVAIDSKGRVYVADRVNERIQIFDDTGKFLGKWTNIGAPWGLAYAAKEEAIYMCDGRYNRIVKLGINPTLEGQVLGVLSSWGKAPGKLDYAHSIAYDPADGGLYTAEIKNWRVQKWVRQ
jgi:DNA-binding beta-propeller fold protein YncE